MYGLQDPYASAGGGYDPYAAEAPQQAAYGAPQQYGGAEYGAPAPAPIPAPAPAAAYGGQGPPPSGERGGPPVPKEQREGDWTCTCGNTNFSWRSVLWHAVLPMRVLVRCPLSMSL